MTFILSILTLLVNIFSVEVGFKTDNLVINLFTPAQVAAVNDHFENFSTLAIHKALGKDAVATGDDVLSEIYPKENGLPVAELKFPLKKDGATSSPEISSGAGLVVDEDNDTLLFEKNADESWSIASITKLMTAMVFLEHNPGWDKVYEMTKADRREGGRIYLFKGEKIKVKDLFYLSLVGSANSETIAMVRSTGLSEEEFVGKMNEKAKAMGLEKTFFEDAVGLSEKNVSTAREVAKIAKDALAISEIANATLNDKHSFVTLQGRKKTVYSTDQLVTGKLPASAKILGGKTGYIEKAGYCFVGKFSDQAGHAVISVVLGESDKDSRFTRTNDLVGWAYENYRWE